MNLVMETMSEVCERCQGPFKMIKIKFSQQESCMLEQRSAFIHKESFYVHLYIYV